MKRLKVLFAVMAVVFASASAFKPATSAVSFFSYAGGDEKTPSNYSPISSDPLCSGHSLCAIQILKGSNGLPDQNTLNRLYSESSGFTVAGTFADGIVELKN